MLDVFPNAITLVIGGAVFAVGALVGSIITERSAFEHDRRTPEGFFNMLMAQHEKQSLPKCLEEYDEETGDNDFLIEEC